MGWHNPKGPRKVDGGHVGGCLELSEGWKKVGIADS